MSPSRRGLPLSPRETQVGALLALGLRNSEIAERLGIATSTIDVHVGKLYLKAGVHNRTKFALWWMRQAS